MHTATSPTLHHLFELPQHRVAVAQLIHDAFWTTVPGTSAAAMATAAG